jgi:hypothetical protein
LTTFDVGVQRTSRRRLRLGGFSTVRKVFAAQLSNTSAMHRRLGTGAVVLCLALGLPLVADAQTTEIAKSDPPCPEHVLCVGVGIADATWQVGDRRLGADRR